MAEIKSLRFSWRLSLNTIIFSRFPCKCRHINGGKATHTEANFLFPFQENLNGGWNYWNDLTFLPT